MPAPRAVPVLFATALLLGSLLWLPAQAQASGGRLLLWGPLPGDTAARIRGQTADLSWSLDTLVDGSARGPQRALAVAEARQVDAVLWVATGDGWTLHMVQRAPARHLARPLQGVSRSDASAAAEAVALVVRAQLQNIDAGRPIGVALNEKAPAKRPAPRAPAPAPVPRPAPEAEPEPTPPSSETPEETSPPPPAPVPDQTPPVAAPDPPPRRLPSRAPEAIGLGFGAGWSGLIDGHSGAGQQGPRLQVWLGNDVLRVGVDGHLALPSTIDEAGFSLDLRTERLMATATHLWGTGGMRIGGQVGIGAMRFVRRTLAVPEGFSERAPDPSLSAVFSASLVLRLSPWPARAHAGLQWELGGLVAPGAPRLQAGDGALSSQLWLLQPHMTLSVYLDVN